MKLLSKIARILGYFGLFLLILFFIVFQKIDRTTYKNTEHYGRLEKEDKLFNTE
jgi:hypothetical protein